MADRRMPGTMENPVMHYGWGSRTFIPGLLGETVPSELPVAELWIGAHPRAPSRVCFGSECRDLDAWIASDPTGILGAKTRERFGDTLPFLLKILAAESPLSIQVHPDKAQAQEGFVRESHLPMDAPSRNYRDPNHKPELLCALTPFTALKGFRLVKEVLDLFEGLHLTVPFPALERLRHGSSPTPLRDFWTEALGAGPQGGEGLLAEAVRGARLAQDRDPAYAWVVRLASAYPGDMGILAPLILHLLTLAPLEALFVQAGELHSYLEGSGVEIMANSDNVLRGGLTPKHIDLPELLRITRFEPGPVVPVRASWLSKQEGVYETPAEEFLLSVLRISSGSAYHAGPSGCVEILLCTEGAAQVFPGGKETPVPLSPGRSLLLPASGTGYSIRGEAWVFRASAGHQGRNRRRIGPTRGPGTDIRSP